LYNIILKEHKKIEIFTSQLSSCSVETKLNTLTEIVNGGFIEVLVVRYHSWFIYIDRHTELQSIHSFVTFAHESETHWAVSDFESDSNPDFLADLVPHPNHYLSLYAEETIQYDNIKSPIILHLKRYGTKSHVTVDTW
jgi:hypothetical protein